MKCRNCGKTIKNKYKSTLCDKCSKAFENWNKIVKIERNNEKH